MINHHELVLTIFSKTDHQDGTHRSLTNIHKQQEPAEFERVHNWWVQSFPKWLNHVELLKHRFPRLNLTTPATCPNFVALPWATHLCLAVNPWVAMGRLTMTRGTQVNDKGKESLREVPYEIVDFDTGQYEARLLRLVPGPWRAGRWRCQWFKL